MKTHLLNKKLLESVLADQKMRASLTKESILYFSTVYFPHYFSCGFAQFQYDMLQVVEDENCPFSVVITFRGSGKSTLLTTISPLWMIMGIQAKKHVLIICRTQDQARTHMGSIKAELEANELLRNDLGPFKETNDTWNSTSLEFSAYGAKISAVSIDQSIRGLRYKQHRPDFIVCDDLEDSSSVRTKESRRRVHELYSSEIAPIGDINTKMIMVGNYLHPNSLLANLRESIKAKKLIGKAFFIPIMNDDGQITWPQMFPTLDAINQLKEKIADDRMWAREYLLKVVADDDQLVRYEDIRRYEDIPSGWEPHFQFKAAGVDLAISKNDRADYTAVVSGSVYKYEGKYHVYIDRNPTNKRFNFRETIDFLMDFKRVYPKTHLFIEGTSYQQSLTQQLLHEGIDAHDAQVGNLNKQERLAIAAHWIRRGQIHFPKDGATDLINQIVNFGTESHDDLMDAFTLLILQIMEYAEKGSSPSTLNSEIVKVDFVNRLFDGFDPLLRTNRRKFNLRTLENDPFGYD